MPNYLTRVELHDAGSKPEKYQELHDVMEAAGFARTVTGRAGEAHLPRGGVSLLGCERQVETIVQKVFNIATRIQSTPQPAVLVSELVTWASAGLELVK
jgi:hypothetical protein